MRQTQKLIVLLAFSIMLVSQVPLVAFGHHADGKEGEARKEAEKRSEEIEAEKNEKFDAVKNAYEEYRAAFKAWKTASENYRDALVNGDQDEIDSAKTVLDEALSEKNESWEKYQEAKKDAE